MWGFRPKLKFRVKTHARGFFAQVKISKCWKNILNRSGFELCDEHETIYPFIRYELAQQKCEGFKQFLDRDQ